MRILKKPIAHRGLHTDTIPENSMAAFRNALQHGYHIEMDVHLSKDGVLYVFHDFSLKRMIGKAGKIEKLTHAELQSGKYTLPNGENIPTFREFLELVDGQTDVLCELKSTSFINYDLEKAVYEAVKGKDWITLQAFNPFSVRWFRKNHPDDVICGQLATRGDNFMVKLACRIMYGSSMLEFNKAQFLAYDVKKLPNKKVEKMTKKLNLPLLSWTIHEKDVQTCKENHVDQIIFEGFWADMDYRHN